MACFFKIPTAPQKIWPWQGLFAALQSSENQFGRPNKKVDKVFNFFFKTSFPRKNLRSAPDYNKYRNTIIKK